MCFDDVESLSCRLPGQNAHRRLFSPVGTAACSQGRQPLVAGKRNIQAPEGRQERPLDTCRPSGTCEPMTTFSRGSAPGYTLPPLRG